MMPIWLGVLLVLVVATVAAFLFIYRYKAGIDKGINLTEEKYEKLGKEAKKLIEDAENEGELRKKQLIEEAKKEIQAMREEYNLEVKERKAQLQEEANKLERRETSLDNRSDNLDKRETSLITKENKLESRIIEVEQRNAKIEELIAEQERKLMEIAGFSMDEAREIVFAKLKEEMAMEMAIYVKEETEKAKYESTHKSQMILANAIQQYANETIQEKTVSVIPLPNDEMKGRIIGREGRNIRAIEAVTGCFVSFLAILYPP